MRTCIVGIALVSALVIAVAVGAQEEGISTGVVLYVEGSTVSSFSGSGDAWASYIGGTTEPQTIEVMKQLRRFCPDVRITANRNAADFLVKHERQGGGLHRNNVAVFGRDDQLLYADGAVRLDNSVKNLCQSQVLAGGTPAN